MRNTLFIVALLIFVGCSLSAFTIGNNIFYANVLNTNAAYGSGAAFPTDVWFDGALGLMRLDYRNPVTNAVFMSIFYNYTSHDKYEVCGTTCARATWNAPMPIFYGSQSTYNPPSGCVKADWPGPSSCVSACNTYVANPAQPQGISSLSYNDTGNALCLVRFSVQSGQTFGPEWHIVNYYTSGFPNGVPSPSSPTTYSSVISGVTCPQPSCTTVLDLAIIVDESGSICNPNDASKPCYWPDVQNFVLGLISTFNMAPDQVRVGLAYFSGLGDCSKNWTGSTAVSNSNCLPSQDGYTCPNCGGRWDTITNGGLTTDKTGLYKSAYDHAIQAGYTCISCGIDIGIKLLNIAPKANVQKLIILFTDGVQNMVTDSLNYEAGLAKSMGIPIITAATGYYKLSDLQIFSTNVYTSTTYSGLSSLINSITAPLCQPLANIDTCDFCSGLCSCATTCNCPNCNDYNMCTNKNCDIRPPPTGTLGACVYTNVTCNDNNVCTVDNCIPASGCDFSTPTPAPTGPPTNTYCNRWNCTNPSGYQFTDFGTGLCPQGSNLCIKTYCNGTVGSTSGLPGSCVTLNSANIPYNTTISYTTSSGQAGSAIGCQKPAGAIPCTVYTCNPVDGTCHIDATACKCQTNADCNDQDGCTTDVCDTNLNQCNHTRLDCWSFLSNGVCQQGLTGSVSTTTGDAYWSGTGSFPFTAQGLPVTGNYACDTLACYAGKRSTYTCQSIDASHSQCVLATVNCTSSGCVDGVCRSLGTWTNGQYNTDCGDTKTRTCNDGNACTTDSCKSTFTGTSCTQASCPTDSTRCNFVPITCTNNNACIQQNICKPASGCDFTQPIATPSPTTCYNWSCDTTKGNVRTVNAAACVSANLCNVTYCNTTQNQCVSWDKSAHFTSETTTFIDQNGFLQSYSGCKNTSALSLSCLSTKCNQATGACYIDTSSCNCLTNTDCNDNNGCTNDTCTGSGSCQYVPIDCWSQLSNGGCQLNGGPNTPDNSVGTANYNLGSPTNPFTQPTGTNQLDCRNMACYSGKRSQYVCTSTGAYSQTCSRVTTDCAKGGCQDTVCGTLGTWTNNQYDTTCVTAYTPTCTSNACYSKSCNTAFVYQFSTPTQINNNVPNLGDYRCNVAYNGTSCVSTNLCVIDQICNNATGCDFTQTTADPFTPNNCFSDTCGPTTGWTRTNNGPTYCPPSNLCQVTYCNTSITDTNNKAGKCQVVDRTTFPVGQTQYYVDSDGLTKSVTGCANPNANDFACRVFGCDPNTGQCTVNIDSCQCLKDSDCYDGTGCTVDKCVGTGKCQRTYIDCYNKFSNGACNQGVTPLSYDNTTGLTVYNEYLSNNFTNSPVYEQIDSNGNPTPNTTVVRTCAQLSCYNGQPSTYTCSSSAELTYTCVRSYVNCSRNGCQDNVCQSLGTWNTNNQIDSNCGIVIIPNCADNNACTSDYCDVAWTPLSKTPRCRHDSLNGTNYCDDGNFCTLDYCDPQDTTGNVCKHSLYSDSYLRKYICKKSKVCQSVQCTVNKCIYSYIGCTAPTLCVFFVCNGSTNGTCKAYPTGAYTIDACGVCGGNGLSCVPTKPGNPKKTSIAVALGVGLGVGLFFAAIIIGILTRKSYEAYLALGTETLGTVTTSPTYQGAEHHLDTGDYHK